MCRICLKDKSSVLVEESFKEVRNQLIDFKDDFLEVTNANTKRKELYNRDYIWAIRQHRGGDNND